MAANKTKKEDDFRIQVNRCIEAYKQLYNRYKQLENTWMLTRSEFLFKVVDNNKFDVNIRQKAQKELEDFLFPEQNDSKEE